MLGTGDRDGAMKSTVVLFLGGCTQTEISALRWMSSQAQGELDDGSAEADLTEPADVS